MMQVVVHHNLEDLPSLSRNRIPVQIYNIDGWRKRKATTIGNSIIDNVRRLGVNLTPEVFDYLTLALAVTAADTFVYRDDSTDGWTREIELKVSLCNPAPWISQKNNIETFLHFLSGDIWRLNIEGGGMQPPVAYSARSRYHLSNLRGLDCVCLFSGGVDSAVGAIDLLQNNRAPLLVSHAYHRDGAIQEVIANNLTGRFSRFAINANPKSFEKTNEISMRSRSFNFLALGVVGACALARKNKLKNVEIFVPENGFISINPPLTSRRIGSLSTRTTHPYYMNCLQTLFDALKISVSIINPYQFKTKGEMINECKDLEKFKEMAARTVSCSNWKRKRKQCGRCVPCLIRRSAFFFAGIIESDDYLYDDLHTVVNDPKNRDDLFALMSAIGRLSDKSVVSWLLDSGPTSSDKNTRDRYKGMLVRGLNEIKSYLINEGLLK